MNTKSCIATCLAPMLLASCAGTMEYEHRFSDWVGHNVDDLYARLGSPSSTQAQADGGSIVSYEHKEAVPVAADGSVAHAVKVGNNTTPAAGTGSVDQASPGVIATSEKTRIVSCTTRYKTDSTGVIRSWTFDGEGCKAHEEPSPQSP